jgi:hypothetical protein
MIPDPQHYYKILTITVPVHYESVLLISDTKCFLYIFSKQIENREEDTNRRFTHV